MSFETWRSPRLTTEWRCMGEDALKPSHVASIEILNRRAIVGIVPDQISYSAYAAVARLLEDAEPERILNAEMILLFDRIEDDAVRDTILEMARSYHRVRGTSGSSVPESARS
ncbi:MAG: hypothetical protein AAF709_09635 [Pseudomonadota bacterium]